MSHILGKSSSAKQPKAIGSLSYQTSARGGVIPLVYGTNKVSPNLLDYDDFTATPVKTAPGKGKGGGKGGAKTTSFTYSASVLWGLGQGPIAGIGTIWENNSVLDQSQITVTVHLGADGQAADPFWVSNHAAKALTYSGTAYLATPNLDLGTSASLPAVTVETISQFANAGSSGFDGAPEQIVKDFLTNPRYGANFPVGNLDPLVSYGNYCTSLLLAISPVLDTQQEALKHLDDITRITNSAIVWSGALLKIIPYGDTAVASSTIWHVRFTGGDLTGGATMSLTMIDATVASSPATSTTASIQNETLDDFVTRFANDLVTIAPSFNVVVSSISRLVGTATFAAADTITLVQQPSSGTTAMTVAFTGSPGITIAVTQVASAAGTGYNPNVTPVYDLVDQDFIVGATAAGSGSLATGGSALRSGAGIVSGVSSDDPIRITRGSLADVVNDIKVEWLDRGNRYNVEIMPAQDQASIDLYGVRNSTPFKARAICDPAVASIVAQLALNRGLLYRNTYTFRLGWKYCLLEPMDLVTLTESRLGLRQQEVRITSIAEDAEGTLTVTAEDFVLGYSSAPLYPKQIGAGYNPNWNAPAGSINPPVIFEPPASLAASQVWIGASGGPNVGTIQVYLSSDGTSYAPLGNLSSQATQGMLTAPLASGSAVDTTHTLAVDLSESRGALTSVSSSDAASLVTLSWVGDVDGTNGELLAWQTATLTGSHTYDVTTLYRGADSSPISAHATGSAFLFVDADPAIGKFPYPAAWVGQTVYFKFLTQNITGGGVQSLASVPAYPYTLTGGTIVAFPVFIESFFGTGVTTSLEVANPFVAGIAISFAPNFGSIAGATSVGRASVAATATATFNIQKALAATPNTWSNIGTMVFASSAVTPTFTTAGGAAQSLAVGDSIQIVAPASPDATLAGVVGIFAGSR